MTLSQLDKANDLIQLIEKLKSAKQNNFQIKIENWNGGNLRPETQMGIKQLLMDELDYLETKFRGM